MKFPFWTLESSFEAVSFFTQAVDPYSCNMDRLGFFPVPFSYGVISSSVDLVGTRFRIQTLCNTASPQRLFGSPDDTSIATAHSRWVRLARSADPFDEGES